LTKQDSQSEHIRLRILTLLESRPGDYFSGEEIGKALGVSRSAVWKQINLLRRSGYRIHSAPNKGYCIEKQENVYNDLEITKRLKTKACVIFLEKTDSTNNTVKALAQEGCEQGTVAVALEQTAGKGRLGRYWKSSKGKGIWLSYCLRPSFSVAELGLVTLAGACAVCRLLKEEGFDAGIKWPNDILIGGKKVCGILTETGFEETRVEYVVVGIGLNVFQDTEDFGPELKDFATSLRLEKDKDYDMASLASALIDYLYEYFSLLEKGEGEKIIECWKSYSKTLGKTIYTTVGSRKEWVTALDIRRDGALIVKREDGTVTPIISGEIWLGQDG
jgi:BirA family biotin operon repressor/biotin-[acetyl-CoA-carboxylase] ligase